MGTVQKNGKFPQRVNNGQEDRQMPGRDLAAKQEQRLRTKTAAL